MKLSVILTTHDEGIMLRTAVMSALKAFSAAYLSVQWGSTHSTALEFVLVLDKASDTTRAVASYIQKEFASINGLFPISVLITETTFGEPGSARNVGISMCSGDIVSLLDADDIMGKRFMSKALIRFLQESRYSALDKLMLALHPEFLMYFGVKTLIWRQPTYTEYKEFKSSLFRSNLWDVTVIAPRHVFIMYPFVASQVSEGAGYEDWEWSLHTSLDGVRHDVVNNTFCYKRAKRVSRLTKDNFNSVLITTNRVRNQLLEAVSK